MLYRPFLHYVSARMTAGKRIDDRYYNCAAAGISVSRNIVHIGLEIQKQTHLIGPYWFLLHTEFFAILSLVYYVLENPDKTGSAEILADAKAGRDVIANLAERSLVAHRLTTALNVSTNTFRTRYYEHFYIDNLLVDSLRPTARTTQERHHS